MTEAIFRFLYSGITSFRSLMLSISIWVYLSDIKPLHVRLKQAACPIQITDVDEDK